MAYSQITFAQMVNLLAGRLGDPGKSFWSGTELNLYLKEALRTWQITSRAYTHNVDYTTDPNNLFINILTHAELTPTITDRDLIIDLQIALQEPIDATTWIGTEQFTYQDLVNAIERKRNEFVLQTGMVTTYTAFAGPGPFGGGKVSLDQTIVDLRWLCSRNVDFFRQILNRLSPGPLTAFLPDWLTPGVSSEYNVVWETPTQIQLAPPPLDSLTMEGLATTTLNGLNPASTATVLGIPNDYCWIIKWGALWELFSQDGPGQDQSRAKYCKLRWEQGIKVARASGLAFQGFLNSTPVLLNSLEEFTFARPNWVNDLGDVEDVAIAGNQICVAPSRSDTTQTVTLTALVNFPMTDPIQIGSQAQSLVLDYAQHLALVKVGGSDFNATVPLFESFLAGAVLQNSRLQAQDIILDVSVALGLRNKNENQRRVDYEAES